MSPPFSIDALELGPMENFVYLIRDHATQRAAVVDPAWEVDKIIAAAKSHDVTITDILLTHSHFDHINGIEDLLKVYDAQIHLLKVESEFWGRFNDASRLYRGGDTLHIGKTPIRILHTPGHTPGSACFHCGNELIAGDTLFVFGCGRCDLAGGDPNQMYDTLRRLQTELPPDTVIRPGHNYADKTASTMAEQIEANPFLHFEDRAEFVRYRMVEHDKIRDTPYHPVFRKPRV